MSTSDLPLSQTPPLAFTVSGNGSSLLLVAQLRALVGVILGSSFLGPASSPLVNSKYSQTLSASHHIDTTAWSQPLLSLPTSFRRPPTSPPYRELSLCQGFLETFPSDVCLCPSLYFPTEIPNSRQLLLSLFSNGTDW